MAETRSRQRQLPYIKRQDLIWLAGLLEGEGYFGTSGKSGCPQVTLSMTDEDVVAYVTELLGTNYGRYKQQNSAHSDYYTTSVCGFRAVELMQIIKPFMFKRRQARIEEVLRGWNPSHRKLMMDEIISIFARHIAGFTNVEIAEQMDVTPSTISFTLSKKSAKAKAAYATICA